MPIIDELNKLKQNISNAYVALENKGATMPTNKNTDNLVTTIESVTGGGGRPTSVNVDFSQGNMVVTPPSEQSFSTVTINKPSTLLPSNVKNGVNIAGVVGTFEGVAQVSDFDGFIDNTLTSITIPDAKKTIYKYAFYYMTALKNLNLNLVTNIGEYAFAYCSGLTEVSIPSTVTSIGSYAFRDCTGIKNIIIDNAIMSTYQFYNCQNVNSVVIGNNIRDIKDYAFYNLNNVKSVTIPNNLSYVRSYAFQNFGSNISSEFAFDVNQTNCYLYSYAFYNSNVKRVLGTYSTINSYAFADCSNLEEVDFNFSSLGTYVFKGCENLNTINFNNKSFSLPSYTFDGCTKLTSLKNFTFTSLNSYCMRGVGSKRDDTSTELVLDFSNCTFTSVPSYAFANLVNTTVILPSNVTTISANAFDGCKELTLILNSSPNLSNVNAFANNKDLTIFIDVGRISTLLGKTNWTAYQENIKGSLNGDTATEFPKYSGTIDLLWYQDSSLTILAPEIPQQGVTYYCKTGPVYVSKVMTLNSSCIISNATTGDIYTESDRIILGTQINIQFVPNEGTTIPFQVKINDELLDLTTFNNVVENFIVEDNINIVAIYYDGITLPLNPTFSENSWDLIKIGIQNRSGFALGWKIGDTKQITTTNGKTYTLRIADTVEGRYNYVDGTPTNCVIEFVEGLPETKPINSSAKENGYYTGGGWSMSDMNNQILPQFFDTLPSDLKAIIPEVTSQGYSYTAPSPRTWTSKLFLMSEYEIFGTRYYADAIENTSQYELYAQQKPAYLKKHKHGTPTDDIWFWTRSPDSGYASRFRVWAGSLNDYSYAYGYYGVAPVFAI